jgi:hypothetical protein
VQPAAPAGGARESDSATGAARSEAAHDATHPDETTSRRPDEHTASAAPPPDAATEREEIVATVTAAQEIVPNSYLITLDNGQVWRQTYAESYPLRPGQHVRLWPSKWGRSFRLSADELRGFIQVERVR